MRETIKAIVSGEHQGKSYNTLVTFTLVPPGAKNYDGNGHYMDVNIMGKSKRIDVRFSQTTDLTKLARIWALDYFDSIKEMQIIRQEAHDVRY